jgi:non-heme chloroperoxidase
MATISINNTNLTYVEKGKGTVVIFVHGSINDYRIWSDQMEIFSDRYRVIAYSRRYHFPNEWNGDGSDYSLDLHVNDLVTLIRALTPDRVHLVGSSYGAYVSLIAAIRNPDLIKSLVLGEPPVLPLLVSNPDNPFQLLSLFIRDFSKAKLFMKFGLKYMKPAQNALKENKLEEGVRLFANGALGEAGFDNLSPELKATLLDNSQSLKVELLGAGFPAFPKDKAREMTIPALFVYGENSPGLFHAISDILLELLPNCEKVVIPGASHLIHCQNAAVYNKRVLEFLSKSN